MSDDLISKEVLHQKIDKIRVSSAEIVVHGTKEKPYFEIKYFDLSDNEMHIGFSSYKLDVVFEYFEKYFDIVNKENKPEHSQNHIIGDLISRKAVIDTIENIISEVGVGLTECLLKEAKVRIEQLDTAFDKEKVIEELKSWEKASHDAGIQSTYAELDNKASGYYQESRAYHRAIEIVEKGGIE